MAVSWKELGHLILNIVMVLAIPILSKEKKYFSVLENYIKMQVQQNVIRKN